MRFNIIKPHYFFLIASICSFIVLNFVTPPLQAPDEFDHFRRAYHISEGHFLPERKDSRLGGDIPLSFNLFAQPYRDAALNTKYVLDSEPISASSEYKLDKESFVFQDFPNSSNYSVISYLPHTIAMSVLKPFNPSVSTIYYAGRFFSFLTWLICFYFFLKIIPGYKWFFTLIVLLPMNLYQANSFSADTTTNVLAFLFIGLVLKYALDEKLISAQRVLILLLVAVLLAFAKIVYVGLVFSVFILPASKFKTNSFRWIFCFGLVAISFGIGQLWAQSILNYYVPYSLYNSQYRDLALLSHCANYFEQKNYLLQHTSYFPKVIYNSIFSHPYTYFNSYIGNFGNSDIPLPKTLIVASFVIIIMVLLIEQNQFSLSFKKKLWLLICAFISFVLLLLSQHLTWDCVGEGVVDLVQGRYLIPLFPFLFLLIPANKLFKKLSPPFLVSLCVFVLLCFSAYKIYSRYYVESFVSEKIVFCNTEKRTPSGFLKSSSSIDSLDGSSCTTTLSAKSGSAALCLSKKCPYGYTYHFDNLNSGDVVEASVWIKGSPGAFFVFTGKNMKREPQYHTIKCITLGDTLAWHRNQIAFTVTEKLDSVNSVFYLWNPDSTNFYIDDIKIRVKKYSGNYLEEQQKRLSLFD